MQYNQRRLLPDTLVRQRYHRSAMTLKRWDQNPALKFPKPIVINGRKYRDEAELDSWEREQAAASEAPKAGVV